MDIFAPSVQTESFRQQCAWTPCTCIILPIYKYLWTLRCFRFALCIGHICTICTNRVFQTTMWMHGPSVSYYQANYHQTTTKLPICMDPVYHISRQITDPVYHIIRQTTDIAAFFVSPLNILLLVSISFPNRSCIFFLQRPT